MLLLANLLCVQSVSAPTDQFWAACKLARYCRVYCFFVLRYCGKPPASTTWYSIHLSKPEHAPCGSCSDWRQIWACPAAHAPTAHATVLPHLRCRSPRQPPIYVVEMVAMATLTPVVTAMNRLEATATKLRPCAAFLPYISCSHKGCGRALRSACRQRLNVAHVLRIFRHFFDRSKRGGSQAHCTPDASCTLGFLTGQGQSTTVMTHGCSRPAKRQQLEK